MVWLDAALIILPALLPCKPLIKKREHSRNVKLDILEIEIFKVVLLHLQQIVKLEVQLQKATSTA